MRARVGMEASFAIAEAAKLARSEVIAAYPITPQTHIVERLADMVANGELDAEYVPVESEHSALSACVGASAAGARAFTATAGQGLELMHEVVYVAPSLRTPVVMAVANRALSGPLSVWGDHSDVMAIRDTGWIQIFAENGQQAFDLVLCAFHIAEDSRVLLPTAVHIDGFHLSHVIEPLYLLDQEEVDRFLPGYRHPYALDPAKPVTMGGFAPPPYYTEAKKSQDVALRESKKVVLEVWEKFNSYFGRQYVPVERYGSERASTVLLTMGSYSETASMAVDRLNSQGENVGLARIRLWRPFPTEELRQAVGEADTLIVLDRALALGAACPVATEVKGALYPLAKKPQVISYVGGLGGRDMSPELFEEIIRKGRDRAAKGEVDGFEMLGVRE